MYAALETAFETALPADAEAVPYPSSAVEETPCGFDVFLPRRRPVAPPPTAATDDAPRPPARPVGAPAPPRHQAPDLAVLGQVLRGLQRMA
ncbi:MAG TPA: hypothetical protein VHW06_20160 [Streptosporangiaceae bacterium]|jgi:hypothetical protein|nr:hypothetical protein [Streptosporangiaceae bacterium]